MDSAFFDVVDKRMPSLNEEVINGLATSEMEHVEEYINRVWECAAQDFPKGLTYDGYRRLTDREEYKLAAKVASGTARMEVARTDAYMVTYQLSWQGRKLPACNVYLPIIYDGGLMRLQGTICSICPVLADIAVSVGSNEVFIPLLRDRITYYRYPHHFKIDGISKAVFFVWSNIHHEIKRDSKPGKARIITTLGHYLFARFGFTETFKRYANADVVVGNSQTINPQTHPVDKWVLCSSTKHKPAKVKEKFYVPTDIVIAVPRQQYSELVENLMAAFFYIADYNPNRVKLEDVDEVYMWRVLLGYSIWGFRTTEGKIIEDIEVHLNSLDGHVDGEAIRNLAEVDIKVNDIYDLFTYLIGNFTHMVVKAHADLPSMYNKRLMVLSYVLKDLVRSINRFMYRINANKKKQLSYNDIADELFNEIKANKALKLHKRHGEVDTGLSSPSDNKYFKITSRIVKQEKSSGPTGAGMSLSDPSNFLHSSIAECGSYLTPSAASPTGHEKINPCIVLGPNRDIKRNEKLRQELDEVEQRIRRI